jgi:hypothetical protein
MLHTSEARTSTGNSSPRSLYERKAKIEGQIEVLKYLKGALCVRELTNPGRHHVEKIIKNKQNDLRSIEIEIGRSSNGS